MKGPVANQTFEGEHRQWYVGSELTLFKLEECYIFTDADVNQENLYWDFTPWGLFQFLSVLDQAWQFIDRRRDEHVEEKTWRINGSWYVN